LPEKCVKIPISDQPCIARKVRAHPDIGHAAHCPKIAYQSRYFPIPYQQYQQLRKSQICKKHRVIRKYNVEAARRITGYAPLLLQRETWGLSTASLHPSIDRDVVIEHVLSSHHSVAYRARPPGDQRLSSSSSETPAKSKTTARIATGHTPDRRPAPSIRRLSPPGVREHAERQGSYPFLRFGELFVFTSQHRPQNRLMLRNAHGCETIRVLPSNRSNSRWEET
jgi:hypothetical protein